MSIAYVSTTLDTDVDTVWSVVGDFHALSSWIGRIRSSEPEGGSGRGAVESVRRLTLDPDGQTVRERLVRYDEPGPPRAAVDITHSPSRQRTAGRVGLDAGAPAPGLPGGAPG